MDIHICYTSVIYNQFARARVSFIGAIGSKVDSILISQPTDGSFSAELPSIGSLHVSEGEEHLNKPRRQRSFLLPLSLAIGAI